MHPKIDLASWRFDGSRPLDLSTFPTEAPDITADKKEYKALIADYGAQIDELQNLMYAHDRYALLLVFQAMDAAGKDGVIRDVMTGVNPHGVEVTSFKRPSETELQHDFLWRTQLALPQRGNIGIFNRSYYEEVLVVRVHPEILQQVQRIPAEMVSQPEKVWEQRFEDIRNLESYLHRNGTHILKFYLHISKDEQKKRFLDRIETPSKNWKFAAGDVKERKHWDAYMAAYEACINATAAPHAPWYVVPGDNKHEARLIVAETILTHMRSMRMEYPKLDEARTAELATYRKMLEEE
ncbi:MAG: polyphosphate kinase 2 family protein [Bacteroidetes bacterium]|nr:MAG: polyphosphate kinase 2 family protein [Bacteroidota bacterium]